jgi:hypothetical protein
MNSLEGVKQSAAAEPPFKELRRRLLEGSGFVPEPSHSLGFRVYMVALEMIFIPSDFNEKSRRFKI